MAFQYNSYQLNIELQEQDLSVSLVYNFTQQSVPQNTNIKSVKLISILEDEETHVITATYRITYTDNTYVDKIIIQS